jgi:hypothetical protein
VRIIAVDGPSGAGKSRYAAALGRPTVPTDHFATWDDPVAWWPRLVDGVIRPLLRGEPGRYRRMDWSGGRPVLGPEVVVEPTEVLVVEGVSSGRRAAAPWLSQLVWVEAADALERAVARDGEASRADLVRWKEFELGWFQVDGTRERADLVVQR